MATVFVCDDETEILRYLKKLLKVTGYQVETFSNGMELLARLQTDAAVCCDAVLLDLRMPDMDGLQVLKQTQLLWPDLPVVIMTGHGTIDDAVQAIKLGAYNYITKPFPKENLLEMVEHMLDYPRLTNENLRPKHHAKTFTFGST